MRVASLFRRRRADAAIPELDWASDPSVAAEDPEMVGVEHSALAERLSRMAWPTPPDEVRERCLREIMNRVEQAVPDAEADADARPADGPRRAAG